MFNEFPYTNYEKINLDWLLDLGNKLKADAESGAFDGERGHGIFGITTIYPDNDQYYAINPGGVTIGDFIIGYGPAAGVNILYLMKVTSVTGNYVNGTSIIRITGPQGAPGSQGAPGPQGEPGEVTQEEFDELLMQLFGVLPFSVEQGNVNTNTGAISDSPSYLRTTLITIRSSTQYSIKVTNNESARLSVVAVYYDNLSNYISSATLGWSNVGNTTFNLTTPATAKYVRFRMSMWPLATVNPSKVVISITDTTAWISLLSNALVSKGNIATSGLNLNVGDFIHPGMWSLADLQYIPAKWPTNLPGKLASFGSDSDSSFSMLQIVSDYYNNYYYRYSRANGDWNDWNNLRSGLYTHRKSAFKPIFTDFKQFKNNYTIPVHTAGASGNVSALYALYDAETANGITITKTSFGKDSSGEYDIYRYQVSKNAGEKPIVLVVVGEHSNEMNSAMVGFYAYKEVVNGALTQYLDYVDFVFVPMLSPWGYDHDSRNNYNGVNINRDFPARWSYSNDAHNTTGNTSMSQVETQYIINYVLTNKEKILFAVNKHDTGSISRKLNGNEEDIVCYLSSNMVTDRTINNGICAQQNSQVRSTDAWIIDDCIDMDISAENLIPSESWWLAGSMDLFFNSIGIHASLLEVSYSAYDSADTTPRYNAPHDADLRRLGLDFFINYLASTIEHCDVLLSNDETVQQTQKYYSRKQIGGVWQNIELTFNRYTNTFDEV